MATAPAMRSFGTTLSIATALVGGLTNIGAPSVDINQIDSTAHDTVGGYKTFIPGLRDGGTLTASGHFSPEDVGQAAIIAAEGTVVAWVITYTDGSTHSGNVSVGPLAPVAELDA